jgi:ABC-2 type transport system ATP-binding protein
MLELVGVCKAFGAVRAVDGLSLSAKPGSIFGLIGPNGAGKTTTIRMIMNILSPDSGRILFDGIPLSDAHKARIGYLPEERGLYRKNSVEEILLYLAALKGVTRAKALASIAFWLDRFDLGDRRTAKISELSKGMAQKVQFIGSVAHDPDLVLFDEPFSGLDPMSQETLLHAMTELCAKGKTVLFSTHIMEHAEKICNEILLIDKGKEVISGPLAAVKASHGRNSIQLEYDGDGAFLEKLPGIESLSSYPRWTELSLDVGTSAQAILLAASERLVIRRFEIMEPSLHRIYIGLVGEGVIEREMPQ